MKKIIIRNTTRTVWSQITKQTDFELDNGIKVSVRQMEDDNQVQTFFFIDGKSKNWVNLCDLDDSDELHSIIKSVGLSTFNGGFNNEDEEIDVKTFIEDAKFY